MCGASYSRRSALAAARIAPVSRLKTGLRQRAHPSPAVPLGHRLSRMRTGIDMTCGRTNNSISRRLALLLFAVFASSAVPAMAQYTGRDRAQLEQAHREEARRAAPTGARAAELRREPRRGLPKPRGIARLAAARAQPRRRVAGSHVSAGVLIRRKPPGARAAALAPRPLARFPFP